MTIELSTSNTFVGTLLLFYVLALFFITIYYILRFPLYMFPLKDEDKWYVSLFKNVFFIEYRIYSKTKDTLNAAGIILLFILEFWFTWALKCVMIATFILILIYKVGFYWISHGYKWLFKKRH